MSLLVSSTSQSNQLIRLAPRLLVVVQCLGTIFPVTEGPGFHWTVMRPHVRYFCHVLRKFKCDVTFLTPIDEAMFPHPFARLRQNLAGGGAGPGTSTCQFILDDPHNFDQNNIDQFVAQRATKLHTTPRRCLLVDAEISPRYLLDRTLVLEPFEGRQAAPRLPKQPLTGPIPIRTSNRTSSSVAPNKYVIDGETKAVVVRRDDRMLIAVADMIREMCTTETTVADYLKVEPLVEKIRVPQFGWVNYLPQENCNDIDAIDLADFETADPVRVVRVPDERPEHQSMWK